MPALGIRNRHLHPVMHQISEWIPTLPVVKKAVNTLHPHLEQERPYLTYTELVHLSNTHLSRCLHAQFVTSNRASGHHTRVLHASQECKADSQNYNGGVRGRVATEFVLVTEAFMAPRGGARALEGANCANALLMHARRDGYVDPAGSVAFFERVQCAGSKTLLLFGGDAHTSELRTVGPPTARAELEALRDIDMGHAITQEPGTERVAAAAAKWVCECSARVR